MFNDSWQFNFSNTDDCAKSIPQWQPEICGRLRKANNLAPLQTDALINFVGLRQSWQTFLKARAQTADQLRRYSYTCGNLSSWPTYFRLLQWRLSDPYKLTPRVAARLVHPLIRVRLQGARILPSRLVRCVKCALEF